MNDPELLRAWVDYSNAALGRLNITADALSALAKARGWDRQEHGPLLAWVKERLKAGPPAPVRVQLSRAKGWKMPANTVKVDRTTKFGNPYRIGEKVDMKVVRAWGWKFSDGEYVAVDAQDAVRKFAACVVFDEAIHPYLRSELGGKNLGCWCPAGQPCHADVLLAIANPERP